MNKYELCECCKNRNSEGCTSCEVDCGVPMWWEPEDQKGLEEFDIEPEELGDLVEWCKNTGLGNIVGLLNAIATNRIIVLPREPGLRTGDVVWVVERDENGIADDYCGYVFLASTMNHVICSSQVNDHCDAEYILRYYERESARDGYCSGVSFFPKEDCYESRYDAARAYESEI